MIKVTKSAADQIKLIAQQSDAEGMALRVAAKIEQDGSYEYGMGFDEPAPGDQRVHMEGVEVIVAENCADLMEDAILDYVEIEEGNKDFVFFNPHDPNHKAPKDA